MTTVDHACLLLHGINGSPYDLEGLAEHLRGRGIAAHTILLPGHQVDARAARAYGWEQWLESAQAAFDDLARDHRRVSVLGHSMGAALGLSLAARDERVAALVALCPPVAVHPAWLPLVSVSHHVLPFLPKIYEDIRGHRERWEYMKRPHPYIVAARPLLSLLRALPDVRASIPQVRCPTLVMAARHDHVVPARDGEFVYRHLGSATKEFVMLEYSWHIVTHDIERRLVFDRVTSFLRNNTPDSTGEKPH